VNTSINNQTEALLDSDGLTREEIRAMRESNDRLAAALQAALDEQSVSNRFGGLTP